MTTNTEQDWSELDALRATFIGGAGLSAGTRADYQQDWERWERFCLHRGFQPLGAPMEAFRALIGAASQGAIDPAPQRTRARAKGPLALTTIDVLVSAVKDQHRRAGMVAAYRQVAHTDEWTSLRKGYQRMLSERGVAVRQAEPMRSEDVTKLLSVPLANDADSVARTALVFAALDLGFTGSVLQGLQPSHLQRTDGVLTVTIPGQAPQAVTCVCVSQGEAAVCTACVLTRALSLDPSRALMSHLGGGTKPSHRILPWRAAVRHVTTTWAALVAGADDGLAMSDDTDPSVRVGTRLGVYYYAHKNGLRELSAQARIGISWPIGLRARDEPSRLRRADVRPEPTGRVIVRLRSSKGDPGGRGETFGLNAPSTETHPTAFVLRWLMVHDSLDGSSPESPLFFTFGADGMPNPRRGRGLDSTQHDLNRLQERAGLHGLTLHSIRVGFAVTAIERGDDILDVQDTLRHKDLSHTLRYAQQAGAGNPIASLVSGKLPDGMPS